MLLLFEESLVQAHGLDEKALQLQELALHNTGGISRSWMTPTASGIHSPSPANAMSSVSTGTFVALSYAHLCTGIALSHRLNHMKLLEL